MHKVGTRVSAGAPEKKNPLGHSRAYFGGITQELSSRGAFVFLFVGGEYSNAN